MTLKTSSYEEFVLPLVPAARTGRGSAYIEPFGQTGRALRHVVEYNERILMENDPRLFAVMSLLSAQEHVPVAWASPIGEERPRAHQGLRQILDSFQDAQRDYRGTLVLPYTWGRVIKLVDEAAHATVLIDAPPLQDARLTSITADHWSPQSHERLVDRAERLAMMGADVVVVQHDHPIYEALSRRGFTRHTRSASNGAVECAWVRHGSDTLL